MNGNGEHSTKLGIHKKGSLEEENAKAKTGSVKTNNDSEKPKKSENEATKSENGGMKSENEGKKSENEEKNNENDEMENVNEEKKNESKGRKNGNKGKKNQKKEMNSEIHGKKSENDENKEMKSEINGKKSENVEKKNENKGKKTENEEKKNENERKKSENERKKSENERKKSDNERKKENERKKNENEEKKNDNVKKKSENERKKSVTELKKNENDGKKSDDTTTKSELTNEVSKSEICINVNQNNLKEKIIIVYDSAKDELATNFILNGKSIPTDVMLKDGIELFLKRKMLFSKTHEYALVVLNKNDFIWLIDFTNDINKIIKKLDKVKSCEPEDIIVLDKLFETIQNKVNINTDMRKNVKLDYVVRIIFTYGRSYSIPQLNENSMYVANLLSCSHFFFDVLYTHEIPSSSNNCQKIFNILQALNRKGQYYIFSVVRDLMDLKASMTKLIAHPLQRPKQQLANYSSSLKLEN